MKGQAQNKKPRFAGLDERDFASNETNIPSTLFAGVAKLAGSALMTPIITQVKNAPTNAKGK